jgi:hypothetical protein
MTLNNVIVISVDHPLSLGKSVRISLVESGHPNGYEGLMVPPSNSETGDYEVYIKSNLDRLRTIELVVHECSHVVDAMFEATGVVACTEMRAYHLDWMVGKFISKMGLLDT